MLITGREHIVFLAQPPSIRFRHAILCKKADVLLLIQSGKTLWLVQCNTYIATGVIRLSLMVLAERRHFTVPIYRALSRPDKTSEQPFIRSSCDNVMEHIIVSFVTSQDREFASEFIFNEPFEHLVDKVSMLRDFSTDLLIEHHLTVNDLIQRLVFLRSKKNCCYAVLASAA